MHPADAEPQPERITRVEQIPGQASTSAEVWLWRGCVPEVGDDLRPWVVLQADDWPMSADTARELAATLLRAADLLESTARLTVWSAGARSDDDGAVR